jgi:hypothetical protein
VANQTENDARIEKITSPTSYVLLHDNTPIYVGSTTRPLSRRLSEHKKEASRRNTQFYNYLEKLDLSKVTIKSVRGVSEKQLLDRIGEDTYNSHEKPEAEYCGPEWTSEMVDVLEDAETTMEAAEKIGIKYHHAQDARRTLDLVEEDRKEYRRLADREVVEIYVRYHASEDLTQSELADEYDVSDCTIYNVVRRQTHEDVWVPSKTSVSVAKAYN